ncbi:protein-tyrosine kinase 6-like [Spea bombifrons]|uniref:protein-tyrosine kinase 6-like n=1 Tax=Spea bombifrons TaxID=233779 RepID=UPI00234B8E47|nr:protein-tyrosine kinase 6-like [Spea bombifrons]
MDEYVVMNQWSQVYVSQWDFEASTPDQLSFKAGDRFHILDKSGDWWTAVKLNAQGCRVGNKGFVPYNYLAEEGTVEEQSWFFGELSRTEAVTLLMKDGNHPGSYLIRVSDKGGFKYALSVRSQDSVKHFKILQNSRGEFYLTKESSFPDLTQLISTYYVKPLAQGLTLTKPCVKHEPVASELSPVPLDEWERPREEFTLVRKLGMGNFSQVYEGYWNESIKIKVAVKMIKKDVTNQEIFMKETAFLKTLRHRNLLSLYAVCSVGDPYYIVTELMPRGDLLSYLQGCEEDTTFIDTLLDIAMQVVDGMCYLESRNCVHRDLAARNVLLGQNNLCKIADFGMARIIKDDCYMSLSNKIPYKWTAPEALSHGCYTTKSDVWSFGVLLHEIMSLGMTPYPGIATAELLQFLNQGYRMEAPRICSKKTYQVMLDCWSASPKDRPSFGDLKVALENLIHYDFTDGLPKMAKFKGKFSM